MSRPVHVAALDAALVEQIAAYDAADAQVAQVLDRHIATLDAIEAELYEAQNARANAYSAVRDCEKTIVSLGYVVLKTGADGGGIIGRGASILDGREYSATRDREAARERAREAGR